MAIKFSASLTKSIGLVHMNEEVEGNFCTVSRNTTPREDWIRLKISLSNYSSLKLTRPLDMTCFSSAEGSSQGDRESIAGSDVGSNGAQHSNGAAAKRRESDASKKDIWSQDDEALMAQKAALLRARMKRRQSEGKASLTSGTTAKAPSLPPYPKPPKQMEDSFPRHSKNVPHRRPLISFDPSQPFDPSFRLDSPESPSRKSPTSDRKHIPAAQGKARLSSIQDPAPQSDTSFSAQFPPPSPEPFTRKLPQHQKPNARKQNLPLRGASHPNPGVQLPPSPGLPLHTPPSTSTLNPALYPGAMHGAEESLEKLKVQNEALFSDVLEKQREMEEMAQREHLLQEQFKAETQAEMVRIKESMESREDELAGMVKELEEAKAQFNLVRAKTTAELAHARQLLQEKDSLLRSAQDALSRLTQVKVEYWGEGGSVKMAGSFNGWGPPVELSPDTSSAILGVDGKPGPMMWEADMYFYPGAYEVKFIVDGAWKVDERREVRLSNMGQNNILRV